MQQLGNGLFIQPLYRRAADTVSMQRRPQHLVAEVFQQHKALVKVVCQHLRYGHIVFVPGLRNTHKTRVVFFIGRRINCNPAVVQTAQTKIAPEACVSGYHVHFCGHIKIGMLANHRHRPLSEIVPPLIHAGLSGLVVLELGALRGTPVNKLLCALR